MRLRTLRFLRARRSDRLILVDRASAGVYGTNEVSGRAVSFGRQGDRGKGGRKCGASNQHQRELQVLSHIRVRIPFTEPSRRGRVTRISLRQTTPFPSATRNLPENRYCQSKAIIGGGGKVGNVSEGSRTSGVMRGKWLEGKEIRGF